MNNGNNQAGANNTSYIKGYIVISDSEPLTAVQLANLKSWFGDSVFDKSTVTSGLVIDQHTEYI